jgi:hypothetical protein
MLACVTSRRVLALVLLFASLPSTIGFVIVPIDDKPAISLDICHPLSTFDQSPTIALLAPVPQPLRIGRLSEARFAPDPVRPLFSILDEAPDPPPPKQRA